MYNCIKCHGEDVIIRYKSCEYHTANGIENIDKLLCKCRTCEYTWKENTKDNKDA